MSDVQLTEPNSENERFPEYPCNTVPKIDRVSGHEESFPAEGASVNGEYYREYILPVSAQRNDFDAGGNSTE